MKMTEGSSDMEKFMAHVRNAAAEDISRIAEILVFSKRTHYRRIFQDDDFSFGVLQVLSAAQDLQDTPGKIKNYWVYDDGFVKGLIHLEEDEISELYVDPFFEHQGIGSALLDLAFSKILNPRLWVLEGNDQAIRFYQKHGFFFTGERQFVPGTDRYEARMLCYGSVKDVLRKIIRVKIDRPAGSTHPEHPDLIYPVNYGYIEGVPGGDGEPQDVYVLGLNEPVSEMVGSVIAVIHRDDDIEEKWVAAPAGTQISKAEIQKQTAFQEKYFRSSITVYDQPSNMERTI